MDERTVIDEVEDERLRQITHEGHRLEYDDELVNGELARAAAFYALGSDVIGGPAGVQTPWPADFEYKPKNRRRDLIRAAALIIAEIERLDRETCPR